MNDLSINFQNESLKELQMLSEKISDLIEQKKFDEIEEIDDHRKKIIKSFYKNKTSKTPTTAITASNIFTDFKYFFVLKFVSFFENAPAPKEMTK